MTTEHTIAPEQTIHDDPVAQVFSLVGTPLLSSGRTGTLLARSVDLTARVKVYAEGGENATHTHLHEDHIFFVLQGEATFYLGRNGEDVQVVAPLGGILLPKGAYYRFMSTGNENLVLFRTGTGTPGADRVGPSGARLAGGSAENHHIPGVVVEGAFFRAP